MFNIISKFVKMIAASVYKKSNDGFTLVETLVTLAIIVIIGVVIANFGSDIFSYNYTTQNNLNAQLEGRRVLKQLISELRSASPSATGAYPIALAGTSSLTFFSDVTGDGTKEQLRYYLNGTSLMRGQIEPTGNPPTYPSANETTETVITNVSNPTSTPIFDYFDTNYAGTSSPLTQPVNISAIRLIRVTVIIDADPNKPPGPITVTSLGTLRNLKDNF
jgi:prepilin-type N-terminal cleavage/methylation domain-containing protein